MPISVRPSPAASTTRTVLIDAQKGLHLRNDQFTDHAHLQWDAVPLLMHYLITQLDKSELRLTNAGGGPASCSLIPTFSSGRSCP